MTDILDPREYAARRFEPAQPREQQWATPGALARDLDPMTVQTPALDLIDAALVAAAEGRIKRLAISLPPQEGKSQRVSRRFPLWLLTRNPDLRIVIAGYELGIARRWGREIRNDIAADTGRLDLAVRRDSSAAHEWQLDGRKGGVYCVGIGGALTGRPADLMIIDDPHKNRKEAESEKIRQGIWDWWTDTARTRLAPGAPVVVIQTRWHEDDLTGRLIADSPGEWQVLNIPAQANHRPDKGQTDPLGREPGQYLESTRGRQIPRPIGSCGRHPDRACCDWDDIKDDVKSRAWEALYQGEPSPPTGSVFKKSWWARYERPQWIEHGGVCTALNFDEVIASWDMAFKDSAGSDYVCGQVWGRRGIDAYLLDQVHDHLDFVGTCQAVRDLAAHWPQAVAKYVEDKANGTAVINALRRSVPGMIPVEPEGSKVARAAAVSPFAEAGNVYLPQTDIAPWVDGLIQEATAFPTSPHDDRVDAMTQALNRLLLNPLIFDDDVIEDDESEQHISPY